jgi:hypothetical protein
MALVTDPWTGVSYDDMTGPAPAGAVNGPQSGAGLVQGSQPIPKQPVNNTASNADYLRSGLGLIQQTGVTNNGLIGGLAQQSGILGVREQQALRGQQEYVQNQGVLNNNYYNQSLGIAGQVGQAASGANAADASNLANYTSTVNGLNGAAAGLYGNLASVYGSPGMQQLQSGTTWAGDLTSQAAMAHADPSAIAAQNNALGFLGGAMNGSLNYTSQGAQAYADPQAIAAQYAALGQLQGAAGGSLDTTSQAAQAYADPALIAAQQRGVDALWDVSQGSKDVHPGDLDPEAYAAQKDALHQYGALTTPEVTAQERFIYESARQQQEQDERAHQAAVMTNLRQRGMSGSGMEIGQAALAGQQTSQNRLLSDLGAQSNAVNRSMQALAGYGGLATNMTNEADSIAQNNANRSTAALGLYTDAAGNMRSASFDEAYKRGLAGDQTAIANANRQLQAMGMSADTAGNIRNSSFNEAYSRGVAADNASANNQQTQLSAGVNYGNVAGQARTQSFNESYLPAQAADATAQFNRQQSIGVSQWQDQYAATQQQNQWNRASDVTTAGLQATGQIGLNSGNLFNGTMAATQAGYGRTTDALSATDAANTRGYNGASKVNDQNIGLIQQSGANDQSDYTRWAGLTGLAIGQNNTQTGAVTGQLGALGGDAASRQAAQLAIDTEKQRQANDPGGLLGTGILGHKDPLNPGNWFRGSIS